MTASNNTTEFKVCSCCGEKKPRTEFFKASCCKDGLRGECKFCVSSKQKTYNKKNAKAISITKKEWQNKNKEYLKEKRKEYYQANSETIKARARQFEIDNRLYVINRKRLYYVEHREQIVARKSEFRRNNLEYIKAQHKTWREKNRERYSEIKRRAKHKRRSATGDLSIGIISKLKQLQRNKCACCSEPLNDDYQLDHILPLALGGTNTDDNVQLLKTQCNRAKHAKHPIDYMQSKGYLL